MPNRRPIIDLRRDLAFLALVLVIIFTIMGLGILLNAPSLLVPEGHWLVGACLLNKTLANTTYIITVNVNTTLYSIETTPNTTCTITPSPPLTGPAVVQLTCPTPPARITLVANGGVVTYNGTMIGNCPS
jgi:hypothetical protein